MLMGLKPHPITWMPVDVGAESYIGSLLHFNGQSGSQNFTDATGKLWTGGGFAQLGYHPESGYAGLDLRSGNGWVDTPAHADFNVGSGDFTFDVWVYPLNTGTNKYIFAQANSSATDLSYYLRTETNDLIGFAVQISATFYIAYSAAAVSMGAWSHIAAVRSKDTLTVYVNGVAGTPVSLPAGGSVLASSSKFSFGSLGEYRAAFLYYGVIDEFRFSRGIARWTADFTPSQYTEYGYPGNDGYTKLMMNFDGPHGDQGTKGGFIDSSTSFRGHALVRGSPLPNISTTQSKFGGSSGGIQSGGYLLYPSSSDFEFGSGDFSVDWWDYVVTATDNASIIARGSEEVYTAFLLGLIVTGAMYCYTSVTGSGWDVSSLYIGPATTGSWHHRAVVRDGNYIHAYYDGVRTDSKAISSSPLVASSATLGIARWASTSLFNGYVDALRVSKGIARWKSNFVPPKTPYAMSVFGANDGLTKLLLHGEGSSGSALVLDHSSAYRAITCNGGAVISSAQAKFGNTSISLPSASSSYLSVPNNSDFDFGSGDFTVEWWDYLTTAAGFLLTRDGTATFGGGFVIGYPAGGVYQVYISSDNANWNILNAMSMGALATGAWHHHALTRQGTTFRTFLDGALVSTVTGSGSIYTPGTAMNIGRYGSSTFTNGYFDGIRISKGIARYTAAFSAPEAPHAN